MRFIAHPIEVGSLLCRDGQPDEIIAAGLSTTSSKRLRLPVPSSTAGSDRANRVGWQVVNVSTTESGVTVRAIGPLPLPNPQTLLTALNSNGLRSTSVQLELDPVNRVDLPGS